MKYEDFRGFGLVRAIAMVSCALLALFPSVTWAAEPLVLEPTSDWILDYGPERCTLQRNFNGSGSDLLMQIVSNGDPYRLRVLMKGTLSPRRAPCGTNCPCV